MTCPVQCWQRVKRDEELTASLAMLICTHGQQVRLIKRDKRILLGRHSLPLVLILIDSSAACTISIYEITSCDESLLIHVQYAAALVSHVRAIVARAESQKGVHSLRRLFAE